MSRSGNASRASLGQFVAVVLAAGSMIPLATSVPLAAQATQPQRSDEAQVVSISAPVVQIHTGNSNVDGSVAIEQRRRGRTAVRLDSRILFGKDSSHLRPEAHAIIKAVSKELRRRQPGQIIVTGYTDDLGTASHGLRLSKRRADTVARQLQNALGPAWIKIKTVGRGEANPAQPNTSEKNRALNRRVILLVEPRQTRNDGRGTS